MKIKTLLKTTAIAFLTTLLYSTAFAQNKDIEKGNEALKKAMDQTDNYKRQEMIAKAKEMYMKGGMKSQEISVLVGDAYLEKGDLLNAYNAYNTAAKEDKKLGIKKVAEAYVEQAFDGQDEKTMAKSLKTAMNYFGKAGEVKEGARMIGDRYFEQGESGYDKALEYYIIGEATAKVEQIANTYMAKGDAGQAKAAESYMKLKTHDGYEKAGDIYYSRKEYQKAIDAYMAGGVREGIQKYANFLYAEHRDEEADNLLVSLAESLAEKKNDDELEKLAKEVQGKGSFGLAAKIYDKAGNTTMADKNRAYDALVHFRLDEAEGIFTALGENDNVNMIASNRTQLNALADVADVLQQLMKGAPYVSVITDSLTGKTIPSASDQKMVDDYYKSIRDQVISNVYSLSANYAKLSNENLKKYIHEAFVKYGAVRNILQLDNFAIKKQKADIKIKDVIL